MGLITAWSLWQLVPSQMWFQGSCDKPVEEIKLGSNFPLKEIIICKHTTMQTLIALRWKTSPHLVPASLFKDNHFLKAVLDYLKFGSFLYMSPFKEESKTNVQKWQCMFCMHSKLFMLLSSTEQTQICCWCTRACPVLPGCTECTACLSGAGKCIHFPLSPYLFCSGCSAPSDKCNKCVLARQALVTLCISRTSGR